MSIRFREAVLAPLEALTAEVPGGAVIGVIGEDARAIGSLFRLAAGLAQPASGEVTAGDPRRYLGPQDDLNLAPAATIALEHTLARHPASVRARALVELHRLRRAGSSLLIASHEPDLLTSLCDEIWWFQDGKLAARGNPRDVLDAYQRHVAGQLRQWSLSLSQPLEPTLRRGDGRAEVVSIATLDAAGQPNVTWPSGEEVAVQVKVRFRQDVEDPVVGIMIRTRIGFEVFGTNTELERVKLGPAAAGDVLQITYRFRCELCPGHYTVTAASHDPDGVWHDWLEEAIDFWVADTRYTAGVVNLRAKVDVAKG